MRNDLLEGMIKVFFFLALVSCGLAGEPLQSYEALKAAHEKRLAQCASSALEKHAALTNGYLQALARTAEAYQKKGDLRNLVKINAELDRFKRSPFVTSTFAPSGPPELQQIQKAMCDAVDAARSSEKVQTMNLIKSYGVELEKEMKRLTTSNHIEAALAVKQELDRTVETYKSLLKDPLVSSRLDESAVSEKPSRLPVEKTFNLSVKEPWPFKMQVYQGEKLQVIADGSWRVFPGARWRGPGDSAFYLRGRLDNGEPFKVGKEWSVTIRRNAVLYLGMNEGGTYDNNSGNIEVKIRRQRP